MEFDEEYFERGQITGKSCYLNYRWMQELTIKMAHNIIKKLKITNDKVLDYGCAKGYLVKALRILDINAYGCDISDYAIKMVDSEVRNYCKLVKGAIPFGQFDWIITKDVLEHLAEEDLDKFLLEATKKTKRMFNVVPLGDNENKFIIPEYQLDKTHKLAKPKDWWVAKFQNFGWKVEEFTHCVRGIKDNWVVKYPEGNGFFTLYYGG